MIPRDLADEFRRTRELLDELWQSVQDADLDSDTRADLSARVENAGDELHIAAEKE